jgi:hypothetical protein
MTFSGHVDATGPKDVTVGLDARPLRSAAPLPSARIMPPAVACTSIVTAMTL